MLSADGTKNLVLTLVFSIAASVAVALRFWARSLKRISPSLDDWLLLNGLVFTWGYAAVNLCFDFIGGLGFPNNEVPPSYLVNREKATLAGQILYAVALGSIKSSICVTLIRIFVTKKFRICASIVLFLCIGWALMTILIAFLICMPLAYSWDMSIQGHCSHPSAAFVSVGVVDITTDILVFVLPIPMIAGLNMSTRNKLASGGMFALGLLTIAAGTARLVGVIQTAFDGRVQAAVDVTIWAILEPAIATIVASGLIMRPLLDKLFSKIYGVATMRGTTRSTARDPKLSSFTPGDELGSLPSSQERRDRSSTNEGGVLDDDSDANERDLFPGSRSDLIP